MVFGYLLFAAFRFAEVYLGGTPESYGFSDRPLIVGSKGGMTTWKYYYGLSFLMFATPVYWLILLPIGLAVASRTRAAMPTP